MSNEVFGVDIAAIVNATFAGNLHPLTLHKVTHAIDDFGATVATEAGHPGEGVRLQWDAKLALARGYPLDAAKILILQNGAVTTPTNDDLVTIGGGKFRLIDIRTDPVNATWVCAAIKED